MTAIAETDTRISGASEAPSFLDRTNEDGIRLDLGVLTSHSSIEDKKALTELLGKANNLRRVIVIFRDWHKQELEELISNHIGDRYKFVTLIPLGEQEITRKLLDEILDEQMSSSPPR